MTMIMQVEEKLFNSSIIKHVKKLKKVIFLKINAKFHYPVHKGIIVKMNVCVGYHQFVAYSLRNNKRNQKRPTKKLHSNKN